MGEQHSRIAPFSFQCNFSFVVETIVKSVSTLTDVYFNVLSPTGSWAIKWEFLFKKRKKKEANVIS